MAKLNATFRLSVGKLEIVKDVECNVMHKLLRVERTDLTACIVLGVGMWTASFAGAAGPLVIDKQTGHYPDLSYEALSDEGLSWEERAKLFGGETVHYRELTDEERAAKEAELAEMQRRMTIANRMLHPNHNTSDDVEKAVRTWLDAQTKQIPAAYAGQDAVKLPHAAVGFFRAHEIFGDKKYLDAGLTCADRILEKQFPQGHWAYGNRGAGIMRIQDGFVTRPFWVMLYAHKVSGDKKYLESARRAGDVLLSAQSTGGGWPDYWSFGGGRLGGTAGSGDGGISFNDGATNATFRIMVMMYHLTGDKKYVAKLGNLGPWLVKANLGVGDVAGWSQQYHGDGRPVRARAYEIELPYTRVTAWHVGPLLTWLYLMDGDEAHMDLLRKAYASHERIRQEDLKYLDDWKAIHKIWTPPHMYPRGRYLPGLPDAYLPDGSNWGCVQIAHRMIPYKPTTPEQTRKYGHLMHRDRPNVPEMGKLARAYQAPPGGNNIYLYSHTSTKVGHGMLTVRRVLLEHKRGGREALLKYYSHPTKFTPDQYLQARIDAAKRALDYRNRSLAVDWGDSPASNSIKSYDDFGWVSVKDDWYVRNAAFRTGGPWSSTVWYQLQLVHDNRLALGKIDADAAARGGRGLERYGHLESWDVLGEWGMAAHEMENYFDVPIGKR